MKQKSRLNKYLVGDSDNILSLLSLHIDILNSDNLQKPIFNKSENTQNISRYNF
jgi:hypothetical protein